MVSVRALRRVAACALPRPRPPPRRNSQKAKVIHRQAMICDVNFMSACRQLRVAKEQDCHGTVTISTTNMTGLLISAAVEFAESPPIAGTMIAGSNKEPQE